MKVLLVRMLCLNSNVQIWKHNLSTSQFANRMKKSLTVKSVCEVESALDEIAYHKVLFGLTQNKSFLGEKINPWH